MKVTRLSPDADLNLSSFEHALELLGPSSPPFLVIPESLSDAGEAIASNEDRLTIVIVVPDDAMANRFAWALSGSEGCVYSVPIL